MKILAIDTSSEVCSTALMEDNIVIDENYIDNGKTHSENLMPLLDELLKRNNIVHIVIINDFVNNFHLYIFDKILFKYLKG